MRRRLALVNCVRMCQTNQMNVRLRSYENRLSDDEWVVCALDALKRDGVVGVRVERLARELGVTKGSFCHHFRDRPELLRQMLRYWTEELTMRAIEIVGDVGGDASDKLLTLMRLIADQGMNRFETAIRAWTSFDPIAA
jgi:AcrR family transcriptional regulator